MSEIRPRGKSVLTSMAALAGIGLSAIAGIGLSAISGSKASKIVTDEVKRRPARGSQRIDHKRPKDGSWAHPKLRRRSKYIPHQGTQEIERRFMKGKTPDIMGSVNPLAKPLKGTVDGHEPK